MKNKAPVAVILITFMSLVAGIVFADDKIKTVFFGEIVPGKAFNVTPIVDEGLSHDDSIQNSEKPRCFLQGKDTPFSGGAIGWFNKNKKEGLKYESLIKDGYVIGLITYNANDPPVMLSEESLDTDKGIRLVRTYNSKTCNVSKEESYSVPRGERQTKDGVFKEYDAKGKGMLLSEVTFVKDSREGVAKHYSPAAGYLEEEILYVKNQKHGLSKKFHKNGKVWVEETFVEDRLDGVRKEFRDDGTLSRTQEYTKDKAEGARITYEKDGRTVSKTEMFKNGQPVR